MKRLILFLFLAGCAGEAPRPTPPPRAEGTCTPLASADPATLAGAFSQHGAPLPMISGVAYACSCNQRRLAGATERRNLAGATEQRNLAGGTEQRGLAGGTEQRGLAGG